jgi:hypothetical protein
MACGREGVTVSGLAKLEIGMRFLSVDLEGAGESMSPSSSENSPFKMDSASATADNISDELGRSVRNDEYRARTGGGAEVIRWMNE